MASLNPLTRELVLKLVFYGPGLGGKTTTLEFIHASTKAENRGQMISLATTTDRTLYFDFLPLRVPRVRGMNVRLQLFTVPGQVYYAATRRLVLSGADALVFVADSQSGRMEANQESLEDLNANLAGHGKALARVPHTFHWNKRDLSDLLPTEELDRRLNLHHAPALGTCATRGDGVFDGLERITRLALQHYEADLPKSEQPALSLSTEGTPSSIADAIRAHTEAPLASKVTPFPGTAAVSSVRGERASAPPTRSSPNGSSASGLLRTTQKVVAPPPLPEDRPASATGSAPPPAANGEPVRSATRSAPAPAPSSAPKAVAPPSASSSFSMAELWPEAERDGVRQTEALLGAGDAHGAVLAAELLFTRILAFAGALAGVADAPRDPGLVALLLGLDGKRYLAFRASVRAARQRDELSAREALDCFTFVLEARRARDVLGRP